MKNMSMAGMGDFWSMDTLTSISDVADSFGIAIDWDPTHSPIFHPAPAPTAPVLTQQKTSAQQGLVPQAPTGSFWNDEVIAGLTGKDLTLGAAAVTLTVVLVKMIGKRRRRN